MTRSCSWSGWPSGRGNGDRDSPACRGGTQPSGLTIDWVPDAELEPVDPRVVRRKADGLVRLTFTSHLRVVRCGDGRAVQEVTGVTFRPQEEVEEFGVEDPRITPLDGRFYFTYVAVSRHGPATALACTTDFRTFERHGVIFCPENKDVVLFPERIGGTYAALHRPVCGTPFTRPEMWVARSPDLIHWGTHAPLGVSGGEWQSGRVGAGPPPVRVPGGWLAIYHGNRHPTRPGEVGTYYGGRPSPRPGRSGPGLAMDGRTVLPPRGRLRGRRLRAERRLPDRGGTGQGFAARLLRGGRRGHGGRRVLAGGAARRDDRRGLPPHGRVMALSTSSSGTVANVLA